MNARDKRLMKTINAKLDHITNTTMDDNLATRIEQMRQAAIGNWPKALHEISLDDILVDIRRRVGKGFTITF